VLRLGGSWSATTAAICLTDATLVERLEPAPDAVHVFRRLAQLPHVVFLDSADRAAPTGRYSFVAADPIAWREFARGGADALASIAPYVARSQAEYRADLPPFQGGLEPGTIAIFTPVLFCRVLPHFFDLSAV